MADQDNSPQRSGLALLLLSIVAVVIGVWAYWPTLARIVDAWSSNPDYTHGILVAPIALWFLHLRRAEFPGVSPSMDWSGAILLLVAGAIRWAAGRYYLPELDAWSIPLWVGGVVWIAFGYRVFRWALIPIAFLWFATPLPGTLEILLSTPLQKLAAQLSGSVLQLVGFPAIVEGTTILLGGETLDVERACSGLRMFYGIFALAVACVVVARPNWWKSLIVLASAAPVAIIANVARISVTAVLLTTFSSDAAQHFSHDLAGFVMIPLAVGLFALLIGLLQRFESAFQSSRARGATWVAGSAIGLAAVGILLAFTLRIQRQKAFETLRETAQQRLTEGDLSAALNYMGQYVQARPSDTEALAEYAEMLGGAAKYRGDVLRSAQVYRMAFQASPDRHDLAIKSVKQCLSIGDFRFALEVCDEALNSSPAPSTEVALLHLRADALTAYLNWELSAADLTWQDAYDALRRALDTDPPEPRHAAAIAEVLREKLTEPEEEERIREADQVVDDLVARRPDDSGVYLARFRYRKRYSDLADTVLQEDLDRAVDLASKDNSPHLYDALLEAARFHWQELDAPNEALGFSGRAIAAEPATPEAYVVQAEIQRSIQPTGAGDSKSLAEPIATLKSGLEAAGEMEVSIILPLVSLLAENEEFDEAEELLGKIEAVLPNVVEPQRGFLSVGVGLVRAQMLTFNDRANQATELLSSVLNSASAVSARRVSPRLVAQGWRLLGTLSAQQNRYDLATPAMMQAGRVDPRLPGWRSAAAGYAKRSGNWALAEQQYRITLARGGDRESLFGLADTLIRQQVRTPPARRDWRAAEQALAQFSDDGLDVSGVLLKADLEIAKGDLTAAERVLREAIDQDLDDQGLCLRGIGVIQAQRGELTESTTSVDKYIEKAEDPTEGTLLKAKILAEADRLDEAIEVVSELESTLEEPDPRVVVTLAKLWMQSGADDKGVALLESWAEAHPSDLTSLDMLANYAWLRREWARSEKYEQWLRNSEGDQGTLWRAYRVKRLLGQATNESSVEYQEAATVTQELLELRPQWATTHFLLGEVNLARGQIDGAITAYERAWKAGGRGVLMADRLIDLLTRQRRFDEARAYVSQAGGYLALSTQLFDRVVPYYAATDERGDALRLAQAWVADRPDDSDAHQRLGRVLLILAEVMEGEERAEYLGQAETSFREAIRLAPTELQPWVNCVMFLARDASTRGKAIETLEEFSQQVQIAPLQREIVLAQLYEALGQTTQARFRYTRAMKDIPDDVTPQARAALNTRVAAFYMPRSLWVSEQYARAAVRESPESSAAVRALIAILAEKGGEADLLEASQLAASFPVESLRPGRDLRAAVWVKSQTGGQADREAMISLLEGVLKKSPADSRLLARLCEQADRIGAAYELLEELTKVPSPNAADLVTYIEFWQRHFVAPDGEDAETSADDSATETEQAAGEPMFRDQASRVYAQLLSLPGQESRWLLLKIREAKLLEPEAGVSSGKVVELVEEALSAPAVQGLIEGGAGTQVLTRVFSALAAEDLAEPAAHLLESAPSWSTPSDAVTRCCHALILSRRFGEETTPSWVNPLRKWLSSPNASPDSKQAIADFMYMSGRYEEAEEIYKDVLKQKKGSATVYNNLALALLEQPGRLSDAQKVLVAALREFPEEPTLQDTRGVLALASAELEAARATLESLMEIRPTDPIPRLHLCMALEQLGKSDEADAAFFEAMSLGLENQLLSPNDRAFVENRLRSAEDQTVAR